ncbi:MAG: hypothetical protein ACJAXY_000934 [Nonlabens sp.]|jgi:hypothetical protein
MWPKLSSINIKLKKEHAMPVFVLETILNQFCLVTTPIRINGLMLMILKTSNRVLTITPKQQLIKTNKLKEKDLLTSLVTS